jgi:hypothetical protein
MAILGEQVKSKTVTIVAADATGLSGAVILGGDLLVGLTLTTWTNANMTFQVSIDAGVTFFNVYKDDGTELTFTTSTGNRFVAVDPSIFAGIQQLKVRSGTAATPVTQAADEVVTLALRDPAS